MTNSLWERVRELPLAIDSIEFEPLAVETASGWTRRTTIVRLRGLGPDGVERSGVGEDVTYEPEEVQAFQAVGAHGFAGLAELPAMRDLARFAQRVGTLDLFPEAPTQPGSRDYRRWAFESAGLDLALAQAGTDLPSVLGRTPRPLTFVVSMGLGDPPDVERVRRWLAVDRGLAFKLDANPDWSDAVCRDLTATGAVACVDLKGYYRGTIVDQPLDLALYERVLRGLPGAIVEDAYVDGDSRALLEPVWHRLAWDAPIHSVADVEALPFPPRNLNVKPSRFGSLERLSDFYEHAARNGIALYGGGQFELGPGRGQAQLLAALHHPTAANDLAPGEYNTGAARAGLPRSPLVPGPTGRQPGFGWPAASRAD